MAVPAMADLYVNVPGTSCSYFAGQTAADMPLTGSGGGDHNTFHGDGSDTDTLPPYVDITGFGGTIDVSATGTWGFGSAYQEGPDGGTYTGFGVNGTGTSHNEYDDLGISLVTAPYNGLVGVFLTGAAPVAGSAPASLSTLAGDDMTIPLLQQTFYIGSSLNNITIPSGATRLFFGLHNGFEWNNNVGSVDVTVVPVPGAVLLGILGLGVAGWKLRKFA